MIAQPAIEVDADISDSDATRTPGTTDGYWANRAKAAESQLKKSRATSELRLKASKTRNEHWENRALAAELQLRTLENRLENRRHADEMEQVLGRLAILLPPAERLALIRAARRDGYGVIYPGEFLQGEY